MAVGISSAAHPARDPHPPSPLVRSATKKAIKRATAAVAVLKEES